MGVAYIQAVLSLCVYIFIFLYISIFDVGKNDSGPQPLVCGSIGTRPQRKNYSFA